MWVRGLKLFIILILASHQLVAPYVGAWIETLYTLENIMASNRSHPMWVRGLKLSQS